MKKGEDGVIALLFLVVCIQAYVVFFKNPAALVKQGQDDKHIQLQVGERVPMEGEGRNAGNLPAPAPSGLYVVNPPADTGPAPAGAGRAPAEAGRAQAPAPVAIGHPPPDPYRNTLLGLAALERDPKLALTPAQTRALLDVIRTAESAKTAVPTAQRTVLAALTDEQKAFIRARVEKRIREGLPPPPPEGMSRLLAKVLDILAGR